jgi:filamentous hemagglutinin family protein
MGALSVAAVASAQIVPDGTLTTNSAVTIDGNTFTLDGGTTAGGTLFHSFQEFSVPTSAEAFFNNASTIDTIITRVTGDQVSNIDGLIRANGTADLFLINPSGIVFGANAKLDIGGSFIGSTADSIQFDDGSIFSATNPNTPPLLTVSVPIGLQFNTLPSPTDANPGEIRVEGLGHDIDQPQVSPHNRGDVRGLQVPTGNTLALVGGNIIFEGGVLTAEAGRIELGSVADGAVSLIPAATGWTLGYDGASNFRDITLLSQSAVDASGNPGGSIQIQGRNLELRDGSIALIQNQGSQSAGAIAVNLSGTLVAVGLDPDGTPPSSLINETVGDGNSGDLAISARNILFQNGGQAGTRTFATGASGEVRIEALDSLQVAGFILDANGQPFISNILTVSAGNSGDAGDVRLSANTLTILDGGQVLSNTVFGSGDGGEVVVNATESVEVSGFTPTFSGSLLAATTFGDGDAGNVTVNTARLTLRDGGRVDANTIARGNAGSVTVNASELVDLSGVVTAPEVTTPTQIGSAANIPDPALQQFLGLPPVPSGSPGNVTVNTPELRVSDGALVTVKNAGTGNAGILSIQADSIFLDNGGITASTASGEGGNLTLQIRDSLQLRNGSQITSEAGGTGNGGNITLDTSTLALLEASRINANAFEGAGGNIQINTQGIFTSPDSAITASSQLGVDGVVQVNNPTVDPSSGLVELSGETTDAGDRILSGCGTAEGNSFTITGRGGLPEDPTATIQSPTVWEDLRNFSEDSEFTGASVSHPQPAELKARRELIEATGWIVREDGTVELVASREMAPMFGTRGSPCRQ